MVLLWSAFLSGMGGPVAASAADSGTTACPVSGDANSTGSGTITIGRKGFAEEQLLAKMTELVLNKHGFTVTNTFEAKDPAIGDALVGGSIDAYWQYTGTELQGPLGVTSPPGDLDQAFQLAKTKDEARGICWNDKGKFNDTNGLAATKANQSKYGATLSALALYLKDHPQTKMCVNSEFIGREDGIKGLNRVYGPYFSGAGVVGARTKGRLPPGNARLVRSSPPTPASPRRPSTSSRTTRSSSRRTTSVCSSRAACRRPTRRSARSCSRPSTSWTMPP
jgi:osmoprotectant transport system substrate-binding protein